MKFMDLMARLEREGPTTVEEFAFELKKSTNTLLAQLNAAGVNKSSPQDLLTDADKQKLLSYLQASHGTSGDRKKITLVKKSDTLKQKNAQQIEATVRGKRTLIERNESPTNDVIQTLDLEKLRIKRIQAQAFKAFRSFDFQLDGRHLLAYGGNGAGKSSLYWLLYTFFQSGQKKTVDVARYFDPDDPKHLLNLHSTLDEQAQSSVAITFQDQLGGLKTLKIAKDLHDTYEVPDITKANVASDFVTYRILSDFYRFRHSERIDLWSVFESEVLAFCYAPSNPQSHLGNAWHAIQDEQALIKAAGRNAKAARIADFEARVDTFSQGLTEAVTSISKEAQNFYTKHFSIGDVQPISLAVGVTQAAVYDNQLRQLEPPRIGFEVKIGEKRLSAPHTFLNEAKLTQLALSVRFGATLALLREAPLKLLVLDDLLISLDMGNRMKVVDIILGETFAEYQKIILTHDRGFYQEFKRRIGSTHAEWSFQCFKGKPNDSLGFEADKTDLQKAEDYLAGHDLDEAAFFLRKSAEVAAIQVRELWEGKKLPPGDFFTLTENLKFSKNKLQEKLPRLLFEKSLKGTPKEHRALLLPATDADLDANSTLDAPSKGMLKGQRKRLRQLFEEEAWVNIDTLELLEQLLGMTDRVLNPAAHGNEVPLYEDEVQKALALVQQFGSIARP
jgi:ABC-type dipeptide/oligopeptide/nickel transport system ATPase subunit